MREQLKLMIDAFEARVNELEEDYRKRHEEDFNNEKMKKYINKKLKMEIRLLALCNMVPYIKVLKNYKSFKY